MMTEAAIDGGFTRNLYAALGEELDNGAWAVRLYYKPFIRWIWAGGLLMALGGLFCLFDPRYRQRTRPRAAVQKMRRRLYEAQRTVNSVYYFSHHCGGAVVAARA